jgi:hypothetical protein
MKVMTIVEVPARKEERFDYMKCELCPSTSRDPDWSPGLFEIAEPRVSLRLGKSYPEGELTKTIYLDICPECFKTKLIPWFRGQGGSTRQTDDQS